MLFSKLASRLEILLCGYIGSGFPKSMNIGLAIDKRNGIEVKSSYIANNNKNNVYGNKFGGGKTDNTLKANNKWQGWRYTTQTII